MSKRREFSAVTKVEIIRRATRDMVTYCEGCGLPCRRWEIDHVIAEALQVDKSRKLTATDGQLLCHDACHAEKTRKHDVPAIARAVRREAAHVGASRPAAKIKSKGFEPSSKPRHERASLPPRRLFETIS